MGDRCQASNLNGSDNLLGKVMRRIIEESMAPMEKRLNQRIDAAKDELKGEISRAAASQPPPGGLDWLPAADAGRDGRAPSHSA